MSNCNGHLNGVTVIIVRVAMCEQSDRWPPPTFVISDKAGNKDLESILAVMLYRGLLGI